MPLYLGLDCSTQGLTAIVIEVEGDIRRVVFNSSLHFDRDFPEYGTTGGVIHGADPNEVFASPLMWADALDRMMSRIAQAAELDLDNLRAIAGSAQQHGSVYLNH
ncbi:MAG: carbohydrate kinase, partial [Acidimicrobiia bacterium]